MIDPGEEPERVLAALQENNLQCSAILVTHAHLDHIGAVGALALATTSPVYTSELDASVLEHVNDHLWPGFGPYVEHLPEGRLIPAVPVCIAGLTLTVFATPGHAAGSVAILITGPQGDQLLAAGDVLFAGSVGRTDLPGGDWSLLQQSIALLIREVGEDVPVLPGHGPTTTLRHERATNPFLIGTS